MAKQCVYCEARNAFCKYLLHVAYFCTCIVHYAWIILTIFESDYQVTYVAK